MKEPILKSKGKKDIEADTSKGVHITITSIADGKVIFDEDAAALVAGVANMAKDSKKVISKGLTLGHEGYTAFLAANTAHAVADNTIKTIFNQKEETK